MSDTITLTPAVTALRHIINKDEHREFLKNIVLSKNGSSYATASDGNQVWQVELDDDLSESGVIASEILDKYRKYRGQKAKNLREPLIVTGKEASISIDEDTITAAAHDSGFPDLSRLNPVGSDFQQVSLHRDLLTKTLKVMKEADAHLLTLWIPVHPARKPVVGIIPARLSLGRIGEFTRKAVGMLMPCRNINKYSDCPRLMGDTKND